MTQNQVVAVVPIREGSQRVKHKNFRPFGDQSSLLHLKLGHLKQAGCFDHIYVSSDSDRARRVAAECGVEFLERDPAMCRSDVRWAPVIHHVVSTVPGDPIVAWVHVTSPLAREYQPAIAKFLQVMGEYDSLLTVLRVQEFLVKASGRPLNYAWGHWHDYSQDLELLYVVTGALFVARKSDMLKWSYVIGTRPYLYEVSRFEAVEIDTEEDFRFAEVLYQLRDFSANQQE